MAVDGRVGNRDMLHGMADALQVEGVSRVPNQINRDMIQPVYDLSAGGMSARTPILVDSTSLSIATLTNPSQCLIGETAGLSPLISNANNQETRITGISIAVAFDAAGSLLFNGLFLSVYLRMTSPTTT